MRVIVKKKSFYLIHIIFQGNGAENRLVASKQTPGTNTGSTSSSFLDVDEEVVDV